MIKRASKRLIDPSPARAAAYAAFYPMLCQIARRHGYALAIHGSLHRDLDLIAVPWVEEASEPLALIKAFKKATRTVTQSEGFEHLAGVVALQLSRTEELLTPYM